MTEQDKAREVAETIMINHTFITTNDNEEILHYNNGTYHENAETIIKAEVQDYGAADGTKITTHFTNEVINNIKRMTYINREQINKEKHLIHLQNGIFNLETMKLQPFNPKTISTIQLPITYNENADCPKIKKFMTEVMHPEDIPIAQEIFGWCLLKDYRFQRAIMLLGDGANGKSTFLKLLKTFLGKENTTGMALQDFDKSNFAASRLYGKLANIFPDLPDRAMQETGRFKGLTGGDSMYANVKFKSGFEFENTAKLIFSANKLPETRDVTSAFYRRWIMINFPNVFDEEKADKKILQKLTTPEELSGLFNWAIEGLKRLMKQNGFSYSKSTEENMEEYQRKSSPIAAFCMDCLKQNSTGWESKEDVYNAFIAYCTEHKLPAPPKNTFSKDISRYIIVEDEKRKKDGYRTTGWRGIELIGEENGEKGVKTPEKQQNLEKFNKKQDVRGVKGVKVISLFKGRGSKVNKKYRKNPDTPDSLDTLYIPEIKGSIWRCNRCGNTYSEKPETCECQHDDFSLVVKDKKGEWVKVSLVKRFMGAILTQLREQGEFFPDDFEGNNELKKAMFVALRVLEHAGMVFSPKQGVFRLERAVSAGGLSEG